MATARESIVDLLWFGQDLFADFPVSTGDDYFADGQIWPEVQRAFDTYFSVHPAAVFESGDAKCYIRKPVSE